MLLYRLWNWRVTGVVVHAATPRWLGRRSGPPGGFLGTLPVPTHDSYTLPITVSRIKICQILVRPSEPDRGPTLSIPGGWLTLQEDRWRTTRYPIPFSRALPILSASNEGGTCVYIGLDRYCGILLELYTCLPSMGRLSYFLQNPDCPVSAAECHRTDDVAIYIFDG